MKLYGIPNCSTVKKERDWSELINRKGLTWRGLTDEQKQLVNDNDSALSLMTDKTSAIKRPLLEQNGKLLYIGFDMAAYSRIFNVKVPT